ASGLSTGAPNRSINAAMAKLPPAMPPRKKYSTTSHSQRGAAVKNVSDIAALLRELLHAPTAEIQQPDRPHHHRAGHREEGAGPPAAAGQLRVGREPVDLG